MENIALILVALVTLMLTGLGLVSMFAPKKMLANFAVEPQGSKGLNTIRSVMGGLFLGCVVMLVNGLLTGQTLGYLAVAIILSAVAAGRVVGLLADGFNKEVIPPLVVELVIIGLLLQGYYLTSGFFKAGIYNWGY